MMYIHNADYLIKHAADSIFKAGKYNRDLIYHKVLKANYV